MSTHIPSGQPNHRTFDVASGEQEAIWGWITANYSTGRLEVPHRVPAEHPTYGFLEMGGQSVQIAYEVPVTAPAPYTKVTIGLGRHQQLFRVFTKMIPNLGSKSAREKYFETPLLQVMVAGNNTRYDRCSIQDEPLLRPRLGAGGSGLCIPVEKLHANYPRLLAKIGKLNESLDRVQRLVSVAGGYPQAADPNQADAAPPTLISGNPAIPISAAEPIEMFPIPAPATLANITRFVGGSSFWHTNRALYPEPAVPKHCFNLEDLNRLICEFAAKNWPQHIRDIAGDSVAQLGGTATVKAITDRTTLFTKFRRDSLFCAMLVHAILYRGIRILDNAWFQPFDGVVGLYNDRPNAIVPYSWTLGRALIKATSGNGLVTVRSLLLLSLDCSSMHF